jgi:hypothetical protein
LRVRKLFNCSIKTEVGAILEPSQLEITGYHWRRNIVERSMTIAP